MRIIILFILSLYLSIIGYSQTTYPNYQSFGSASTLTEFKGAGKAAHGFVNGVYADTTSANIVGFLRFYPGAQIVAGDSFYVRDQTASRWLLINGGAGGGGSGTLTNITWTPSQGVSAVITNPTTTPNITVSLGALTGVTSLNGLVVTPNTGTITTGIWNGTAIGTSFGGTGLTSLGTAGQSIRVNAGVTGYEFFNPAVAKIFSNGLYESNDSVYIGERMQYITQLVVPQHRWINSPNSVFSFENVPGDSSIFGNQHHIISYQGASFEPSVLRVGKTMKEEWGDTLNTLKYGGSFLVKNSNFFDSASTRFRYDNKVLGIPIQGIHSNVQVFAPRDSVIWFAGRDGQNGSNIQADWDLGESWGYDIAIQPYVGWFPLSNVRSNVDLMRVASNTRVKQMTGPITGYLAGWKGFQSVIGSGTAETGNYWSYIADYTSFGTLFPNLSNGTATKDKIMRVSKMDTAIGFVSEAKRIATNEVANGIGFNQKGVDDINHFEGRTKIGGTTRPGYASLLRKLDVEGSFLVSDSALFPNREIITDTTGFRIGMYAESSGLMKWMTVDEFSNFIAVGGSSLFPTTGTGTATGAVTGDLDGNILTVVQGGVDFLHIDPTAGSEDAILRAFNATNDDNEARAQVTTSNDGAEFSMLASFNGGEKVATIVAQVETGVSNINYIADTHTLTGAVIFANLAGNGTGIVGVDNAGQISFTTALSNPMTTLNDIIAGDVSGGAIRVPAGTPGQFLRIKGDGSGLEYATIAGGGDALTSSPLSQFAATTSSQFFGVISDETGTGLVVGNNSPTFLDDITVGTASTATGVINIKGTTSGTVALTVNAAAGTPTITFGTVTGTVAITGDKLSAFASTTSSELAGVISNETGTGVLVFGTAPSMASITLAAGTATAGTAPLYFTSGTELTVPVSGAVNFIGTNFFTTTASGRGLSASEMFARVNADFTLANSTSDQTLFPSNQNLWILQGSTTYKVKFQLRFTTGSTTHTYALGFTLGGGASITSMLIFCGSWVTAINATSTARTNTAIDQVTSTVVTANSTTSAFIEGEGYIVMDAGGTVEPIIKFSADPTGTCLLKANSYITFTPIGSNTVENVGNVQ